MHFEILVEDQSGNRRLKREVNTRLHLIHQKNLERDRSLKTKRRRGITLKSIYIYQKNDNNA